MSSTVRYRRAPVQDLLARLSYRAGWDDQTEVIRDGRADVSYIRLPADQSGLQVQALLTEPRVAVLPVGHRLAGKDTISIADLADAVTSLVA